MEPTHKDHCKVSGIYCFTNKINGKKYIGQTICFYDRYNKHKRRRSGAKYFQRAIAKYGWENFTFGIIEKCPIEELYDREESWIKFYGTLDPEKGYNIRKRQNDTLDLSAPETQVKIKNMKRDHFRGRHHTEESKRKIVENNTGQKRSPETKRKLSETRKRMFAEGLLKPAMPGPAALARLRELGKKKPLITPCKPVQVTNLQTGEIVKYMSVQEGYNAMDIIPQTFINALKGRKPIPGYVIEYIQ